MNQRQMGAQSLQRPAAQRLARSMAVFGPGLVVMLADTDVGSVITAGQSGVQWGYRLLALQLLLMPILYMVQELTVRLGIFTGRGHGALICDMFGQFWGWVSAAGLGISTVGALLAEFSGVAGVGELYGVPRFATLPIAAAALLGIMLTRSYRRVELVAIILGSFELAFFFVAWAAHPDPAMLLHESLNVPYANRDFLYLAAANIGSVVMPWMIYYQQSAIAGRRLGLEHYAAARWDTAIGAVLTQLVMAAVLIACAATIGRLHPDASLASVGAMAQALTPFLGTAMGNLVFGAGVLGAGMVAAIVCSLAFVWGLGEVSGHRRPAACHPFKPGWVHGVYAVCVIGGAGVVALWPDLVSLNVGVQVMNALMLPAVLGLLIALSIKALPRAHRLRGWYLGLVLIVTALTCALGVFGGFSGVGLLG
jgi:NRAMP (natural resistance-associated macrophage protein)-like metal ion transporter